MTGLAIAHRRRHTVELVATVAGATLFSALVWLASQFNAQILQGQIPESDDKIGQIKGKGGDLDAIINLVNMLLSKGVWIVMILAPLGVAWGAGAMIFGGRSGPQIIGSSIVAVVLVGSASFVAR